MRASRAAMRSMRWAGTTVAATVGFAGFGLAAGSTSASAASPCDYRPVVNNSSASFVFTNLVNIKSAPATECGNVYKLTVYEGFYAWCYVNNYYGNQWVYGRISGTQIKGWTSIDNLGGGGDGSLNRC